MQNHVRVVVDRDGLPDKFPTHMHNAAFWECLGRAVATFGFLEDVLARSIFAFTPTRPYDEAEIQQAYDEWLLKLERTLRDPLGNLIDVYAKAVRDHPDATVTNLDLLVSDLRRAAEMRNILCHGSWEAPIPYGASVPSVPFFVTRKNQVVVTPMDHEFLAQVQRHVAELACAVMNTVTSMGWRFPGSGGPGKAILSDEP
jgi:hypothetical protein